MDLNRNDLNLLLLLLRINKKTITNIKNLSVVICSCSIYGIRFGQLAAIDSRRRRLYSGKVEKSWTNESLDERRLTYWAAGHQSDG